MVIDRRATEAAFARHLLPLARRWHRAADDAMRALGISNSNGWVLVHVSRTAEGIQQGALAGLVDISEASLVRRLDQLVEAGLVTREPDPLNRRANYVRLTEEGRALARRMEAEFAALRATLLADIDDEQLATANAVLTLLDDRIVSLRDKQA
jgi:MarR family transcriptional regulator for hemolysin